MKSVDIAPTSFLPFHIPDIGEGEIKAVSDTLRSGWITTGPRVREFEAAFARFVGTDNAVALSSCTAALHLALEALGLSAGDEVLVPTMTFAATAEVVTYFGARPVLIDCEAGTLNLDPCAIEPALTPRTRAIIPVHFAGNPCRMEPIMTIARAHQLRVIEDAAHALPARYHGTHAGTLGDIGCFSFYATKTLATGEGGMAVTANPAWAERMRIMSLHGISKDAWKRYTASGSWYYEITAPGFKYNMTDVAASLGIVQLARCKAMRDIRERYAMIYDEAFRDVSEVDVLDRTPETEHAWHLYVIRLQLDRLRIDRGQFINELKTLGIGTSVHFIPLHLHPYYRDTFGYRPKDLPNVSAVYPALVSLPIYSRMTEKDVARVIDAVSSITKRNRR